MLRSHPDLQFLKWWMLAAISAAAVVALLYEVVQGMGLRAALLLLAGVPVGLLQSLVLEPYFHVSVRVTWTAGTALGWAAGIMWLLFLGTLTLASSGINAVSDERIGQCLLQTSLVAGGLAGYVQALYSARRVFGPPLWGIVNAVAWSVGGVIGGLAAQALNVTKGEPWFEVLVTTPGLFLAMLVYGAITGLAALLVLRYRRRADLAPYRSTPQIDGARTKAHNRLRPGSGLTSKGELPCH